MPFQNVKIYASAGIPYYRRLGANLQRVKLRTAIYDDRGCNSVAVRAPGGKEYYADLLAFVVLDYDGTRRSDTMAFVRCYAEENASDIAPEVLEKLQRLMTPLLKVERDVRPKAGGGSKTVDFTDLIPAYDILRPVYIQPNPLRQGRTKGFLYNRFVV